MAILYDARGNEIRGWFPDSVNNETITDARPATNNFTAAAQEILIDLNGACHVAVDLRSAACVLTAVFEATIDGTNYFALPAFAIFQSLGGTLKAEEYVPSVTGATTVAGAYVVGVTGYRRFRLRCSAFTSGSMTCAVRSTQAAELIYAKPLPSTLHVTATAAANTAATATLTAAGVGLFHYITNIHLCRNATAALVGTATLIHTTTNLPGSPAWSVGNAMVAGGTQIDLDYTPATPLKSSVANTNTTVVMAAGGLAVLNRVNVTYYVGQ